MKPVTFLFLAVAIIAFTFSFFTSTKEFAVANNVIQVRFIAYFFGALAAGDIIYALFFKKK